MPMQAKTWQNLGNIQNQISTRNLVYSLKGCKRITNLTCFIKYKQQKNYQIANHLTIQSQDTISSTRYFHHLLSFNITNNWAHSWLIIIVPSTCLAICSPATGIDHSIFSQKETVKILNMRTYSSLQKYFYTRYGKERITR